MTVTLLASGIVSAVLILLLCLHDPKRRRTLKLPGAVYGTATRRLLAAASFAPGGFYILTGNGAAFLIWLGAYAVVGWLVAQLLCNGRPKRHRCERSYNDPDRVEVTYG